MNTSETLTYWKVSLARGRGHIRPKGDRKQYVLSPSIRRESHPILESLQSCIENMSECICNSLVKSD